MTIEKRMLAMEAYNIGKYVETMLLKCSVYEGTITHMREA